MNGVLVVDKVAGVSSARALNPVKRALGRGVRVGHAGTLDPFATGTLLVMVGDATRLVPLVSRLPKHYLARVRFGVQTDTLDPRGEVTEQADPGPYNPDALNEALFSFRGAIEQVPPQFSAVKVGGRRAYKIARAGKEVALTSRVVQIMHLGMAQARWPLVDLHIVCGSGTYIRSLARDLGAALGVPAMLDQLRRVRIGPFDVSGALEVSEKSDGEVDLECVQRALIPPRELAFSSGIPRLTLDPTEARRFVLGQRLRMALEPPPPVDDGPVAVFHEESPGALRMVGLGKWKEGCVLSPHKVFASVGERLAERSG